MNVLFVLSASAPGFDLEELAAPYFRVRRARYGATLATPSGRKPLAQEASWFGPSAREEALRLLSSGELERPRSLETVTDSELSRFGALVIPGGGGALQDLRQHREVARLLRRFHAARKPIALPGRGQAALLSIAEGAPWPFRGYRLACCEELGAELEARGAVALVPHEGARGVVEHGELFTVSGAAGASALADAMLRRLEQLSAAAPGP